MAKGEPPPGPPPKYKRVLLKLSGEALMGPGGQAISSEVLGQVADEVVATAALGCELALVLGGGNIFRGVSTQARGMERSTADVLLKATSVDGVYDKDPKKHPDAKRYSKVTYMQCLQQNLTVMDMTAFALCRDNKLPMIIFDMMTPGNVQRVVKGEHVGTIVVPEDEKAG